MKQKVFKCSRYLCKVCCRGPAPAGSKGSLRMTALANRESKEGRDRGLIFLGLHRKPIKFLTWNLLCSRMRQVPSQWGEDAGCPLPDKDAGHLPNGVLETQAKKWTESPCASSSHPEREQREKRRENEKKEWHGETKLWWSRVCSFIFKRSFYTLGYTFPEVKDTESCRVSSTIHRFDLHWDQDVFLHSFSFTRVFVLCTLSSGLEAYWHFMTFFWSRLVNQKTCFPLNCFFFIFPICVSLRKY